jgi:hypothetical protein
MPASTLLPPLPVVTTLDGVVDNIQKIIDWSKESASRFGYFAALYKRITIAVRTAVADGVFEDGERMALFDALFAGRYFDAINGHFHPERFAKPTRSWQQTFDAATRQDPIILQHMLAGVNTHIDLDLGIAAQNISPGAKLPTLHNDFNTINAVLASQINGILDSMHELSPALADLYAVLQDNEVFAINQGIRALRDSAWRFASVLAVEPSFLHPPTIWARDRKVAGQGELVFHPPGLIGVIDAAVKAIAARESRDIVHNIEVLDRIASAPAPIATVL